mgnify:CR=1 FL=1
MLCDTRPKHMRIQQTIARASLALRKQHSEYVQVLQASLEGAAKHLFGGPLSADASASDPFGAMVPWELTTTSATERGRAAGHRRDDADLRGRALRGSSCAARRSHLGKPGASTKCCM